MAKITYVFALCILGLIYTGRAQQNDSGPSIERSCPLLSAKTGCTTDDINIDGDRSLSRIESDCLTILPGERVSVHCNGLRYGLQHVTCLEEGVWSPSSIVCLSNVHCVLPNSPPNGYIPNQQPDYSIGPFDNIQIRCNEGFDLVGSSSAYCRRDGNWSRKIPQCIAAVNPLSCDRPDVSGDVTVTPARSTYTNGTDVGFSCSRRNHALLGEASSVCINGTWSPDPAECYVLSNDFVDFPPENCQRRLVPDGVQYSPMQYSYQPGRSVIFSCASSDYSLVGEPISTCQARIGWDNEIPQCVLKCPQPSSRSYTRLHPENQVEFRNEDLIILECDGEARTSTCINGVWTPELGFCSSADTTTTAGKINRQIEALTQEPVTNNSINRQLPDLVSLTTNPDERIVSEDVRNVVTFLEKVTNLNSSIPMVTNSMLQVMSNLMNVEEIELQNAQQNSNATNRALDVITKQLNIVDISSGNKSFIVAHENLAVRVSSTTVSESADGSVFAIYRGDRDDDEEKDGLYDQITYGSMNEDLFDHEDFRASVMFPSLVHFDSKTRFSAKDSYRVSFVAYQKASLFVSYSLTTFNSRETSFQRRPSMPIISATIHGMDDEIDDEIDYLNKSATSTFDVALEPEMVKNIECVYWDFNGNQRRGDWSSRGCRRVPGSSKTRPACRCRRLANFAVLLDVYNEDFLPLEFQYFAQILTYVGCGLSTCGLILTIIAYASSSKLRNKQPNQILLCLISSLLGLYATFMLVIGLGPGTPRIPCGILAALLHFFALSSLAWMGIEGVNVYLLFVRIINSYIPRFIRKAAIFGWGIPAVTVFVIGCIFRKNYARGDMCLIQRWPNITGLLIPVGLILLFNIIIFILVMKRISSTTAGKIQDNTSSRHRERVRRLRNAFILLLLLGLTWLFGFLVNIRNEVLVAFSQFLFVILNAFQGFFIFLLYCIRIPQARMQLINCCRYIYCPFDTARTSSSNQNKNDNVIKNPNKKGKQSQLTPLKTDKASRGDSSDTLTTP